MSWPVVLTVLLVVSALVFALVVGQPKFEELTERLNTWRRFHQIAERFPQLSLRRTQEGLPQLVGSFRGLEFVIDERCEISAERRGLGMRCPLPDAAHAPNAALWFGGSHELSARYGESRPMSTDGIFDVYTRVGSSPSDWWEQPELHEALLTLKGAALVLYEGQLTLLFDELDEDSLQTALTVPGLVIAGVRRPTIH